MDDQKDQARPASHALHDPAAYMRELLATLSPREQLVLEMRFGLNEDRQYTEKDVGNALGVSDSRINQIQWNAIRKLRYRIGLHYPKPVEEGQAWLKLPYETMHKATANLFQIIVDPTPYRPRFQISAKWTRCKEARLASLQRPK